MFSPLPYRRIVIKTFLSPDKAASILSSRLGPPQSGRSIVRRLRGSAHFRGTVDCDGFKIRRIYPWWFYDSFLPVLYGKFISLPHGTDVDVRITMNPFTIVIMAVFFVGVICEILSSLREWANTKSLDAGLGSAMMVVLIGYALMIFSFNHHADIAEDFLNSALKAR